jgi:DNA-binding IclR family transcriptional regulator
MHAGASAKTLMAHLDKKEQDRVIKEEGLPKFTEKTITDPDKLKKDLEKIRNNGFCVSTEELDPGVRGIAAPIIDKNGELKAGLSISGPVDRITDSKVEKFIPLVVRSANEIAKLINKLEGFYE